MMATKINPYQIVGTELVNGMDEIIKNLGQNPSEEDLATEVFNLWSKYLY